jgi:hypothetical protein
MHQFEATLYSSTTICDWSDEGECKVYYFFYNSDFFRFKDTLDAAIGLSGNPSTLRKSSMPPLLWISFHISYRFIRINRKNK